jgi:uncharacterized OB-fold protein/acyl dehydratase
MSDPKAELMARLRAFEGRASGEPQPARFPVNVPMIEHWCDAIGDRNPAYLDADWAATSPRGQVIAPPTMLQAWVMPGLRPWRDRPGASSTLGSILRVLDEAGFTSVVATNCEQEYQRELVPGDVLRTSVTIEHVSDEKRTALGTGHFVTQLYSFCDESDAVVATMRFRMLKFRPPEATTAAPVPKPARPRPRPGITHDNRFFWDGVRAGKLLIQRCAACERLRHPPGPMCPGCRSLEWDTLESAGSGEVYSYVLHYHPQIPPFEAGHPVALVALDEGTRLVADLVGVEPDAVHIGMRVQVEFNTLDDELVLPQFRPVAA